MDVSAGDSFRQRPSWLVIVAVLLIGQGWLTLRLFTIDSSFDRLTNDEPIVSGRHPLHYYHGMIGSKTWLERDTSSCFDPAYQAGYPKTPVFDGGSRPAEFFQIIGGTRPAAYKIGLAICFLFVPLAFVVMARGAGLPPATSCVAGLLGGLFWWSEPCQALVSAGDIDLLLGGLCILTHVTWLIRFERSPGIDSWIVMTLFASLAWYTQPLLVAGYIPFLLLFYLWVAVRQGPIWHLAVTMSTLVAFGVNYLWLNDWARHLWLYLPFGGNIPTAAPFWPTISREWRNLLPADPVYIGVGVVGLLGLLSMLKTNRASAWLLGLGVLGYVLAAAAGKFWPVLADFGIEKLLFLAFWCLALPAAHVLTGIAGHLGDASGWRPVGAIWLVVGLGGLLWSFDRPRQLLSRPTLEIGLNADRSALASTLKERTTAEARILWEDRAGDKDCWTPLLAPMTERPFLGGLDPGGRLEHMFARLCDGKLCGKSIGDKHWNDDRLRQFIERYNIGWAVCWTPESIKRFRALPMAKPIADVHDGIPGVLFAFERKPTYFLKGKGTWVEANGQRIALAEIEPENGEVVLSIHYQSKMRVSPFYVHIERDIDLDDPIPFVRLRLAGRVARLTIIWDNP